MPWPTQQSTQATKNYYKNLFTHPIQTIGGLFKKPATPAIQPTQNTGLTIPAANAQATAPVAPVMTAPRPTSIQPAQIQPAQKQIYKIGTGIYDATTNQRIPDVATLTKNYFGAKKIATPTTPAKPNISGTITTPSGLNVNPATGGIAKKKFYRTADGKFYEEGTNRYISATEFGIGTDKAGKGFAEVDAPTIPDQTSPTIPDTTVPPPPTPYETAATNYEESLKLTPEEIANQENLNRLEESARAGITGEGQRAIPMEFITGRQKAISEEAVNQQLPLIARASLLQAKRTAAIEASKFKLGLESDKLAAEKEAKKLIAMGAGSSLYDPTTRGFITAPKETAPENPLDIQQKLLQIQKLQNEINSSTSDIERQTKELQLQKLQNEVNPQLSEQDTQRATAQVELFTQALAKTKDLSKYAGSNTTWEKFKQNFGATNFQSLIAQSNTLRALVLTMAVDPNIKKFFGPQMSNADVQLMMSAGTTLNPELQKPADFVKELTRLEDFIKRITSGQTDSTSDGGFAEEWK